MNEPSKSYRELIISNCVQKKKEKRISHEYCEKNVELKNKNRKKTHIRYIKYTHLTVNIKSKAVNYLTVCDSTSE